jgi:hypothetical protein
VESEPDQRLEVVAQRLHELRPIQFFIVAKI